jgi:16S rRNA (cytosine1402-N4)-methyltransferase
MSFEHKSVLLTETLALLNAVSPNGIYVDATLGLGGHSSEILKSLGPLSRLIGIDCDQRNLDQAAAMINETPSRGRFIPVKGNFRDLDIILANLGIAQIDGIIYDLGVSSAHFDDDRRGFSFSKEAPLDMRLDMQSSLTAADVVNNYRASDLERVIRDYGEEYKYKKIADYIIKNRPVTTTTQLAGIIANAKRGMNEKINPATKVFQAIRIEVNDELGALKTSLEKALKLLKPGGRIVVIAFHSLEDRIVKRFFAAESIDCICENKRLECTCAHKRSINLLAKKAIMPQAEETAVNPRARSAKLRAAEKISGENI